MLGRGNGVMLDIRGFGCHHSGGHFWQGRFKSPVIQDDEHLLAVLRHLEANPLRAGIVERAGDYPWSSFACHGQGWNDPLLDAVSPYEALARYAAVRQRRWSAYMHAEPEEAELAALRRSIATGLPYLMPHVALPLAKTFLQRGKGRHVQMRVLKELVDGG